MTSLTPRAQKCLIFLRAHFRDHGFGPSYREIGDALGIRSKSHVLYLIDELQFAGFVERPARRQRGLKLLKAKDDHRPDCACADCAHARYLSDLKLVQALQVAPPASLTSSGIMLTNLRPLSHTRRIEWLGLQRKSSVRESPPKMSPAKAG